jgi:hypothetical protein
VREREGNAGEVILDSAREGARDSTRVSQFQMTNQCGR